MGRLAMIVALGCILVVACVPMGPHADIDQERMDQLVEQVTAERELCTRSVPPDVLDSIANVIPERVWVPSRQHYVEIVSVTDPIGAQIGAGSWIVSVRVTGSDLITIGHNWVDPAWLVGPAVLGEHSLSAIDWSAEMLTGTSRYRGVPSGVEPAEWEAAKRGVTGHCRFAGGE